MFNSPLPAIEPSHTLNKDESIMDPGFVTHDPFWSFRLLDHEEVNEFRQSARIKYIPFSPIEGIWHPVYQMECVLINHKLSYYKIEEREETK